MTDNPSRITIHESLKHADALLTIDLAALVHNWRAIGAHAAPAVCGAVVKANAYGLGMEQAATKLYKAGCCHFFVATLDEALALRSILSSLPGKAEGLIRDLPQQTPDRTAPVRGVTPMIALFNGLRKNQEKLFLENNLTPILNTMEEVAQWNDFARRQDKKLPAILHVDTGMNRLGLSLQEAEQLKNHPDQWNGIELHYLMSHLACIDEPDHAMNKEQLKNLNHVRHLFPNIPVSFSNSMAGLGAKCYHFDLVRPGICMYGSIRGLALPGNAEHYPGPPGKEHKIPDKAFGFSGKRPIKPVITLTAPVIQLREIREDGYVGYGATYQVKKGDRIAILPVGYADGYPRALSNKGSVAFGSKMAPLAGRVSMDLIAVDVSHLPEVRVGSEAELIGENITIDFLADMADTIAYEILTRLGSRYKRRYIT